MNARWTKRLGWLVLGLACIVAPEAVSADEGATSTGPTMYRLRNRIGVRGIIPPGTPPWYTWFPSDANQGMQPQGQTSPYPNWPSPYPPTAPPATPSTGQMSFGASPYHPYTQVGYPGQQQVPSYWYGR